MVLYNEYIFNPLYDSPFKAKLKGYKNTNGFSVNVYFPIHFYNDNTMGCIFGEELEYMIDDMNSELAYYKSIGIDVKIDTIDFDGCEYEVLEDNLGLILQFTLS